MDTDPVIDEIREIRHRISEKFGHDPRRLAEFYRAEQKKYASRLWRGRTHPKPPKQDS